MINYWLRTLGRKVIPLKARRIVANFLEGILAYRLMVCARYRDNYIRSQIDGFEPNKIWANRCEGSAFRIAAGWDADGRFRWLYDPCVEGNIGIIHFPRSIFRPVFAKLFQRQGYKPDERKGEVSLSVFYEERFKSARKKYLKYCEDVAVSIARQYSVDVFLLFKLNDEWIIDVIRGIRQAGYRIVVHDREYGITRKRMEVYPPYLRTIKEDLLVDRLCLTNQTHYEFFEACGFPTTMLSLTGRPDTDFWFKNNRKKCRREFSPQLRDDSIVVAFFAFGRFNYLNFFYKGESRNWGELADDYHDILLDLISEHGEKLQIVYKIGGKPVRDSYPGFGKFFDSVVAMGREDSLVVLDSNSSTIDLLCLTDAVLGFHTLGLAEAMFTDQPIFYGAWGPLFDDIKDTLIPFHKWNGLDFIASKVAMKKALNNFIAHHDSYVDIRQRSQFRENERTSVYYRADGQSAERLLKVIKEVVGE